MAIKGYFVKAVDGEKLKVLAGKGDDDSLKKDISDFTFQERSVEGQKPVGVEGIVDARGDAQPILDTFDALNEGGFKKENLLFRTTANVGFRTITVFYTYDALKKLRDKTSDRSVDAIDEVLFQKIVRDSLENFARSHRDSPLVDQLGLRDALTRGPKEVKLVKGSLVLFNEDGSVTDLKKEVSVIDNGDGKISTPEEIESLRRTITQYPVISGANVDAAKIGFQPDNSTVGPKIYNPKLIQALKDAASKLGEPTALVSNFDELVAKFPNPSPKPPAAKLAPKSPEPLKSSPAPKAVAPTPPKTSPVVKSAPPSAPPKPLPPPAPKLEPKPPTQPVAPKPAPVLKPAAVPVPKPPVPIAKSHEALPKPPKPEPKPASASPTPKPVAKPAPKVAPVAQQQPAQPLAPIEIDLEDLDVSAAPAPVVEKPSVRPLFRVSEGQIDLFRSYLTELRTYHSRKMDGKDEVRDAELMQKLVLLETNEQIEKLRSQVSVPANSKKISDEIRSAEQELKVAKKTLEDNTLLLSTTPSGVGDSEIVENINRQATIIAIKKHDIPILKKIEEYQKVLRYLPPTIGQMKSEMAQIILDMAGDEGAKAVVAEVKKGLESLEMSRHLPESVKQALGDWARGMNGADKSELQKKLDGHLKRIAFFEARIDESTLSDSELYQKSRLEEQATKPLISQVESLKEEMKAKLEPYRNSQIPQEVFEECEGLRARSEKIITQVQNHLRNKDRFDAQLTARKIQRASLPLGMPLSEFARLDPNDPEDRKKALYAFREEPNILLKLNRLNQLLRKNAQMEAEPKREKPEPESLISWMRSR